MGCSSSTSYEVLEDNIKTKITIAMLASKFRIRPMLWGNDEVIDL